ncbi:Interferon gamma receptor 2 [Pristimantis euphronides]
MWPLLLALTSLMSVSSSYTNASSWDLPTPTNVNMDSYNMKHILRWNPVQLPNVLLPVMYRVECDLYSYSVLCVNITETHCDLTDKIKPFWRAVYKVRAELGERSSAWAAIPPFQATRDTRIGPVQSLVLETHGNSMIVKFSAPFPPISTQFRFLYLLYYWKESAENKVEVSLKLTHYVLEDLEELTVYCVQVKASTDRIEGEKSDPECARTEIRENLGKKWAVIVTSVSVVCGICFAVGYMIYRTRDLLKRFLYPPFRMPYHIREFLENPPEEPYEEELDHIHTEEDCDSILVIELSSFLEDNQMSADPSLGPAEKT